MAEVLITLILIVVTIAGVLAFLYFVRIGQTAENEKKIKLQGVVKHDWLPHRLKVKNPKAPAVKREAEEDWGR